MSSLKVHQRPNIFKLSFRYLFPVPNSSTCLFPPTVNGLVFSALRQLCLARYFCSLAWIWAWPSHTRDSSTTPLSMKAK